MSCLFFSAGFFVFVCQIDCDIVREYVVVVWNEYVRIFCYVECQVMERVVVVVLWV